MNLSQHFRSIATGQNVRIHTLEINKPYQVLFARRLTTTYGPTVELTLKTESEINSKIFLPKRYAEIINDDSIEDINNGKKYIIYFIGARLGTLISSTWRRCNRCITLK